jgi:hypothetical protein
MFSSSNDESFVALVNSVDVNNASNTSNIFRIKRRYRVHPYWKNNQQIKRSVFDAFKDLFAGPEWFQSFYRIK